MPDVPPDTTPKFAGSTITLKRAKGVGVVLPAALTIVFPAALVRRIPLALDPLVLGRDSPNRDGVLIDGTVSRRHLSLTWDGRARSHVVADLESHNGSWLDGVRLGTARTKLHNGAVLRLGGVLAVYEQADSAAAVDDEPALADAIPGSAFPMRRLRRQIALAAADPSPALVIGPTGAGKEHVARALHTLSGRGGPWVPVNVTELSPQLAESQLFGHVRGAFTGAAQTQAGLVRSAEGGTLCLDEIGELPLELQPKLLRMIQEREVRAVGATRAEPFDVRIVAATNRDLGDDIEAGRFRRDLWARLALWELTVPALSERRSDILGWIDRLHRRWCEERGRDYRPLRWEVEAAEAVLLADFPENLRGLDRLVHRLAIDATDEPITVDRLGVLVPARPSPTSPGSDGAEPAAAAASPVRRDPPASADELRAVLEQHDGNINATARWYGCHRRQVYRWLDSFGIERDRDQRG